MEAKFEVTKPETVEFSLTITMTLKDWELLREQLKSGHWPASEISSSINSMIVQAQKTFWPQNNKGECNGI